VSYAELDDGVVRQPEELGRPAGFAAHRREQALAPVGHAAARRGHHRLPAEEVGGLGHRDLQTLRRCKRQRRRHVGRVHEAEIQRHAPEVAA